MKIADILPQIANGRRIRKKGEVHYHKPTNFSVADLTSVEWELEPPMNNVPINLEALMAAWSSVSIIKPQNSLLFNDLAKALGLV